MIWVPPSRSRARFGRQLASESIVPAVSVPNSSASTQKNSTSVRPGRTAEGVGLATNFVFFFPDAAASVRSQRPGTGPNGSVLVLVPVRPAHLVLGEEPVGRGGVGALIAGVCSRFRRRRVVGGGGVLGRGVHLLGDRGQEPTTGVTRGRFDRDDVAVH